MRIQSTHPTQPRRVYPDRSALKLRDAELYFDSAIIGETVTLADLDALLTEAERPSYNGVLIEQQALAGLVAASLAAESNETKEWVVGEWVSPRMQRLYGSRVYECTQGHATQTGWEPHLTSALWKELETLAEEENEQEIPPWKLPKGAHDAYSAGDKVTHNEQVWVSTAEANVWEPGVYGWVEEPEEG